MLGIGVGAEYPCGSVSASEQSEQPGIDKKAQHRWFALATSESCPYFFCLKSEEVYVDSMIDFGFVISAFVPLVLYWMYVSPFDASVSTHLPSLDSVKIISAPSGDSRWV